MSKWCWLLLLCACTPRQDLAPVVERKWQATNIHAQSHTVVSGETLYAIAFRYDEDYHYLAKINNLNPPYLLHSGQTIRLKIPQEKLIKQQEKKIVKKAHYQIATTKNISWGWPLKGNVVTNFNLNLGKKGINIQGKSGEKIVAAAQGVVAYAGDGIQGYGNLIIIKSGPKYLAAYGNNSRIFVKEGQQVQKGQVIAIIGMIDRKYFGLHFEIRKLGKPVNPTYYLRA